MIVEFVQGEILAIFQIQIKIVKEYVLEMLILMVVVLVLEVQQEKTPAH